MKKSTLALVPSTGSDARRAARFRVMLGTLIQRGITEMSGSPFGMMLGPFAPMILPAVSNLPDEQALGILAFVESQLHFVQTGDLNG